MSYTVLALKWRPKGFDEVVGQPHIVSNIASAIEKNRVAHAYLFSGPRGVGKTSCARIFAKALNCASGPTPNPCGKCPSCLDIAAGRSLDVLEIDGASNRGIDEIRTLRENVKFAPASGRFKVYIIDEVHQITPDGFNALLKTLEEPPEFVKFIFATTAPQKVPSTILSRCQRMDFRRISVMEIIGQLERITGSEGAKVSREVLFAVARASDGALRDAESILDQLLSFSGDKASVDDVTAMLGNVQLETLFQIGDAVQAKESRRALELVNDLIDKGKDPMVLLHDLVSHFRNLMVARVSGPDTQLIDLPKELCDRLAGQSQGFALEQLFSAFNILVETQELSRRMESVRIPLEISLVRLCSSSQAAPAYHHGHRAPVQHHQAGKAHPVLKEPVKAQERPAAKAPDAKAPDARMPDAKTPDEPESPAGGAVALDAVRVGFAGAIEEVGRTRMSVATYLRAGQPESVDGNCVCVSFPRSQQFYKEFVDRKENRMLFEKCLSARCGGPVRVKFILADREATQVEGNEEKDPAVKSAMDMFKGRLL